MALASPSLFYVATTFDVIPDAAGRPAGAAAVEVMEATVLGQQREVGRRALEVVVVHFYEQHIGGRGRQPHDDFRDDAALTKAPEHGVEQTAIALVGAGCDLAVAGYNLELLHMVDLKTKVVGGYAESPVLIVPPTDKNVSAITGTVSFWAFAAMRTGRSVPIDNADHRPVYWSHNSGPFGIGQRAARSIPERWPAVPLLGLIITAQGHRRAHSLCLSASVRTQEHLVISVSAKLPDYKILAVSSRNVLAKENPGRPADGRGS